MRFIRMFSLAGIAATAALAFVGASNSSADTICTNLTIADSAECPLASRLGLPQTITATSSNATFTASGAEPITCTESNISGIAKTNDGSHTLILGLIESLTFKKCSGLCTEMNKGGNIENLPYLFEALALTLLWHVKKDVLGDFAATLEHCTVFNINCLLKTTNALLTFDPASGKTPAKLLAINVPLVGPGFPCPSSATLNATYTLTSPNGGLANLTALP